MFSLCAGFKQAGKLEEDAGRNSAAAALYIEIGTTTYKKVALECYSSVICLPIAIKKLFLHHRNSNIFAFIFWYKMLSSLLNDYANTLDHSVVGKPGLGTHIFKCINLLSARCAPYGNVHRVLNTTAASYP